MAIINLRDYYPFYTSDYFMEVPEDVVEMFKEFDRKEAAYRLRTYRHKAYYSLDRNDGIEHEALFVAFSPYELYERKVTIQELYTAISRLPDKQAKRIYAHFVNAPYQVPYKLKAASAALLHCFFGFLTTSGNFSDHGSRSSKNDRSLSSMRLGISVRRCSKYSYGFRLFAFAVSAML